MNYFKKEKLLKVFISHSKTLESVNHKHLFKKYLTPTLLV